MNIHDWLAQFPDDLIETDSDILASRARDRSRLTMSGRPAAMLCPRNTDEVAECLRRADAAGLSVIPRGAGTGLSGGANAPDGSVVLSLHRMNRILEVDAAERLAVVQPAVVTGALRERVAQAGLFYPPDPGSVDECSIGGNISTNAGGMCCVKYGVTGDYVLGLEVVLADGRVMRTGRRTVKGVAGYDLTSLFVGAEGTLGVVTEATIKLRPAPGPASTLVAQFDTLAAAGAAVDALLRLPAELSMFEIMDGGTLAAVDDVARMGLEGIAALLILQSDAPDAAETLRGAAEACQSSGASDVYVSDEPDEMNSLLAVRRLALTALERRGSVMLDDVAVPRRSVCDFMREVERIGRSNGVEICVFGHVGDGNLHPTIVYDDADDESQKAAQKSFNDVTQAALQHGGTITGEHGVGRLKPHWLEAEVDPVAVDVHRRIKSVLDPRGTLNPGAV